MEPTSPNPRQEGTARATAAATVAGLAAYAVAFVQQVVYGRRIGVGGDPDALAAALAWAIAVSGLLGTTFAMVIIPRHVALASRDPSAARSMFRAATTVTVLIAVLAAAVTLVAPAPLASVLLPGADGPVLERLETLLRVTAPLLIAWVFVWQLLSLANARGRFVLAALSPVVAALPVIAVLLASPTPDVVQVAVAYLVGALLQVATLVLLDGGAAAEVLPSLRLAPVRPLLVPLAVVGAAFVLFSGMGLLVRASASIGSAGDVAIVDYGLRLIGVMEQVLLGGALAVVTTTWARGGGASHDTIARPLVVAVGLTAIAAGGLGTVGADLARVLFGSAAFTPEAADGVGTFLRWSAAGAAAHMVLMLGIRGLFARQANRPVFLVAAASIAGTLVGLAAGLALNVIAGAGLGYTGGWVIGCVVTAVVLLAPAERGRLAVEAIRSILVVVPGAVVATAITSGMTIEPVARLVLAGTIYVVVAGALAVLVRLAAVREARSRLGGRWSAA